MSVPTPHWYPGPIRLVVLDLAGTTIDYGSRAPLAAFLDLFHRHGIELTEDEARGPMGMHKRQHIAALLALPRVERLWHETRGVAPGEADIQRLYEEFQPIQFEQLPKHADLIPGVLEAIAELRAMGCRIAATTGYPRDMTDVVLAEAARQGFVPDVTFSGSEVPAGRPAPWLALACARELGVYPMAAVVKAGDTVVDVQAGLNAGMWSLGIAATGNMLGLSLAEADALSAEARERRLVAARTTMQEAGAHAVLDSVADLPAWVDRLNRRSPRQAE
jgi:phosphonoacetaldehyde hydrolase